MNSISATTWAKAIVVNYYVSSILFFAVCLAALMSGSVLAILAGLVLYIRPVLYISVVNSAINWVSEKFAGERSAARSNDLVLAN